MTTINPYLESLNQIPLFEKIAIAMGFYQQLRTDASSIGATNEDELMRMWGLYQKLQNIQKGHGIPDGLDKETCAQAVTFLLEALEESFSKVNVEIESPLKNRGTIALYDEQGNKATFLQLMQNPDAKFHWETKAHREGTGLLGGYAEDWINTKYYDAIEDASKLEGVSMDSSGTPCVTDLTRTFEASGRTLLDNNLFTAKIAGGTFSNVIF